MPHSNLRFSFFCESNAGRVRASNEDAVAIDASSGVVVLADGMGGHNAGEVASALAVRHVMARLARWASTAANRSHQPAMEKILVAAIQNANHAIYAASLTNPGQSGMGTTLVAAVFSSNGVTIAHAGDSRAYLFRHGELLPLTQDHSLLAEAIAKGALTTLQAAVFPQRNVITRALGVGSDVTPELTRQVIVDGDYVLICSDGLTDMLSDLILAQLFIAGGSPEALGRRLIAAANAAGGQDNISVALIHAAA